MLGSEPIRFQLINPSDDTKSKFQQVQIYYSTYVCDYNMSMIEHYDTFVSRTPNVHLSAWACEEPGSGETNSTVTLKRCLQWSSIGSKLQRDKVTTNLYTKYIKIQSLQQHFFGIMPFFHLLLELSHPLAIPTFSFLLSLQASVGWLQPFNWLWNNNPHMFIYLHILSQYLKISTMAMATAIHHSQAHRWWCNEPQSQDKSHTSWLHSKALKLVQREVITSLHQSYLAI